MDKLFRKRAASATTGSGAASGPSEKRVLSKGKENWDHPKRSTYGKGGGENDARRGNGGKRMVSDAAPSLDVDIRNSLILPGLSQRFSILLPSLSSTNEDSLRSMLATQRAGNGPSLTLEEEELLIAEMRDAGPSSATSEREWDGRPPPIGREWSNRSLTNLENGGGRYMNGYYTSESLIKSNSSPSLLYAPAINGDAALASPSSSTFWSPAASPLPTSTSFTSFRTFGAPSPPDDDKARVRTKSYGFGAGSSLRDGDYMRKIKKSASTRNVSGDVAVRESGKSHGSPHGALPEEDVQKLPGRPESPSLSDRTATPTSAIIAHVSSASSSRPISSDAASTLDLNDPVEDVPSLAMMFGKPQTKQRKSLLAGLSAAQVKRISAALVAINEEIHSSPILESTSRLRALNETEEVLDPADEEDVEGEEATNRRRSVSNATSEVSTLSQSTAKSSTFHYQVSPTTSNFSATVHPPTAPATPSRIPASPPSRNLRAAAEYQEVPEGRNPLTLGNEIPSPTLRSQVMPQPILTPTRAAPIRHTPSSSIGSSSSAVSFVPGYIPGQPRPVGSILRSEASSSRSATPQAASPVVPNYTVTDGTGSPQPLNPPQIGSRSSSLSRSQRAAASPSPPASAPISGSMESNLSKVDYRATRRHGSVSFGDPFRARRLSSPLAQVPPVPTGTIVEDDEEATDGEVYDAYEGGETEDDSPMKIQHVSGRRSVADSVRDYYLNPPVADHEGASSHEGVVGDMPDAESAMSHSHMMRLVEDVPHSARSSYAGSDHFGWDAIDIDGVERQNSNPEKDFMDLLTLLTGLQANDMRIMQSRLVEKAKAEREQLRAELGESPSMITAHPAWTAPANQTDPSRAISPPPPSSWRAPNALDLPATKPITSPIILGTIYNPPAAAIIDPTPEQTPSSDKHDEILTPPLESISRTPSTRAVKGMPTEDEEDKAKRLDFERRIAQATADLNRTPTVNQPKLSRKGTKKGAMVISSPTLVSSSSAHIATKSVNSPEWKEKEKEMQGKNMSGSASKMGMRWKKLGFGKRGPSISGEEVATPTASNAGTPIPSNTSTPNLLDGPIKLQQAQSAGDHQSPDLKSFKFPLQPSSAQDTSAVGKEALPSPPSTANPTTGLKQMMGKFRRGRSDDQSHDSPSSLGRSQSTRAPAPLARVQTPAEEAITGSRRPSAATQESGHSAETEEGAMVRFIAAGRAVGLSEAQINDMLQAQGKLSRSNTVTGHPSTGIPAVAPRPERKASLGKASTGLFRGLSKSKKATSAAPPIPDALARAESPSLDRNKIVRRTLLLPDSIPHINSSPAGDRSPSSPDTRPGAPARTLSVKRKPINLSPSDKELVSRSPVAHSRKTSAATMESGQSAESAREPSISPVNAANGGGAAALGFLHPGMTPDRPTQPRNSSISGQSANSLLDMYGDHPDEMLAHGEVGGGSRGSNQAVEIMEYEDGRVVWSIVDALRMDLESDMESSYGPRHSLQGSIASSRPDSEASGKEDVFGDWRKPTPGLNLRHRDRDETAVRPETNVYYTSPSDVADLIDHLSNDLNTSAKGRIDILPNHLFPGHAQNETARSSPFHYPISNASVTPDASPNPHQFEDAPSPQRSTRPPPLVASASGHMASAHVPAGGFSPKRQMFMRQGLSPGTHGVDRSPTAPSFGSDLSGLSGQGRSVEDRLQALLDRLKSDGVGAVRQY